jgi:hypothetical protein
VGSGSTTRLIAGRLGKAKTYKKYSNDDVIKETLAYYILPRGTTLAAYSKNASNKVPLSTMRRLFCNCKVFETQADNASVGKVEKVFNEHLIKTRLNKQKQVGPANTAKRYLTDNEQTMKS